MWVPVRRRPGQDFAATTGEKAAVVLFCGANTDPSGRTFSGPGDFNTQLTTWLAVANRRVHRTLQTRPTERWEADRVGMLTLPPVDPPAWWRMQTRIGRDHYVRVDTNDYSVHPDAIGRIVTVLTDNDEVLALAPGGVIVARHPRCWARHQTITDPDHAEAGKTMRGQLQHHQQAARQATAQDPSGPLVEVEQRELGSYDRMFTVIEGGGDREAG
ncbi:Mu transposase domain-containing protein [Streptomyces mirabilis]|uniref:Mu transposase domain-containing protein n=1 Tax=Streptomyces mirabilis TaxID=68239 RepID=UPI001E2D2A36|nr:hypothetical protein [Streptomyces mirabilis]